MGVLWMGSNLAYGYGSSSLGPAGVGLGWPMMMGAIVLTANGWGAATGEWKGSTARAPGWLPAAWRWWRVSPPLEWRECATDSDMTHS